MVGTRQEDGTSRTLLSYLYPLYHILQTVKLDMESLNCLCGIADVDLRTLIAELEALLRERRPPLPLRRHLTALVVLQDVAVAALAFLHPGRAAGSPTQWDVRQQFIGLLSLAFLSDTQVEPSHLQHLCQEPP